MNAMKMKMFFLLLSLLVISVSCSSKEDETSTPPVVTDDTDTDTEDPNSIDPDDIGKDWEGISVPANAGEGKKWKLQTDLSDGFNYTFAATETEASFGGKWTNFYHNDWEGPGPTKWVRQNVSVSDGNLELKATRVDGEMKQFFIDCDLDGIAESWTLPVTRAGCITSARKVHYPVYVESRVRVADAVTASDVWLLSADDTQEIDIIEAYGGLGQDNRNVWAAQRIHLSHHTFIRQPFQDYQPTDANTWWQMNGVSKWGGEWVRVGVYWRDPKHLEYYINGQHVRTVSDNAYASRDINGNWQYTYPRPLINGTIQKGTDGFQAVFNASSLEDAQNRSATSVIDPLDYLGNGMNLDKEMDIIINMEDQNWNACNGRTPTNAELEDLEKHTFKIDWIRIYKPIDQ